MSSPRNSAKAVIVEDGRLLVLTKRNAQGQLFHLLPGGGQERGETLPEAVKRECLEELGVLVEVGELLCVRDYIARHHEFAAENPDFHAVDFMFACQVPDKSMLGTGVLLDDGQENVEWIAIERLPDLPFWPKVVARWLQRPTALYLGDIN